VLAVVAESTGKGVTLSGRGGSGRTERAGMSRETLELDRCMQLRAFEEEAGVVELVTGVVKWVAKMGGARPEAQGGVVDVVWVMMLWVMKGEEEGEREVTLWGRGRLPSIPK
jgi:hypothetical protein